jgi:hypothetical protein
MLITTTEWIFLAIFAVIVIGNGLAFIIFIIASLRGGLTITRGVEDADYNAVRHVEPAWRDMYLSLDALNDIMPSNDD